MKCCRFALPLVLSMSLVAPAAAEVGRYDRFRLWAKCEPLSMLVLALGAPEIGLEQHTVQTAVRSRLRTARLAKLPNDLSKGPLVSVGIDVSGQTASISVYLMKPVKDLASGETAMVTTWETGSLETHDRKPDIILNTVLQHLDEFIDEYLRVNAAACEP